MEILYLTLFFIFGSIMGSFFFFLSVRVTKGESILKPRSHCEKCGHILKWYELIPILSFLIQGGKCRKCKTKLNIGYIFMEICTGVLFAVCYHVFGLSLNLLVALIFVSSLIITIISDIEYMVILDEVLITAILGIIVVYLFNIGIRETAIKVLSATGSFITMLAIKKMGDIMFKQESLGGGDIKLMFLIGLVLGYPLSICNIFLATFIAFPIALVMLITNKDNIIPFGPFLSMAALTLFVSGITFSEIINYLIR